METSNFDRLLNRYLNGETSEQETAKIEAWLDVVKTENTSQQKLSKEEEEKLFQKIISNVDNLDEIRKIVPPKQMISMMGWTLRIAAGIVVIALVSYIGWSVGKATNGSIEVASTGPVKKVILEDGTLVWLKGNSKLVYYEKKEEGVRYSELKGEALYEVAKDASHPFIINCGNVRLKVLGTSFTVRTNGDSMELQVLTGKVNLSSDGDANGVDVLPNQKAIFTRGKIDKLSIDVKEALSAIADTQYDMQYVNAPLEDVIAGLEKKFDQHIVLENKEAGKCSVTLDLTDQSLDHSLSMITEVLDVDYKKEDDSFLVSGQGCH